MKISDVEKEILKTQENFFSDKNNTVSSYETSEIEKVSSKISNKWKEDSLWKASYKQNTTRECSSLMELL